MKWWRKKKGAQTELPSFIKAGLTGLNLRLLRLADYLQQKTNSYPSGKQKILLFLFMLVFVTGSLVVTIQSVTRRTVTMEISRIKSIRLQTPVRQMPHISINEVSHIQSFKNFMDSLGKTPAGRKVKDSLLKGHPRLMDSVNLLDRILEQSKTK